MLHTRGGQAPRNRLAGGGSKPPPAAQVQSLGGARGGHGRAGLGQVRATETSASEPLRKCRKRRDDVKTGGSRSPGRSLGATCLLPRRRPA
jgi:hypothetical protein